jgi:hypothetical protein
LFWRGLPTKDSVCGVPRVFPPGHGKSKSTTVTLYAF